MFFYILYRILKYYGGGRVVALVACLQTSSTALVNENLEKIENLVESSVNKGARLVVLPENATFIGCKDRDRLLHSEKFGDGLSQNRLSGIAKKYNIWLIGGTIPIFRDRNHVFASCIVWNNNGKAVARYDKIHLFDVIVNNEERYFESDTIFPGKNIVTVNSPFGIIGMSICYDLRFPELFRFLMARGSEIIVVISAFTETTGKAHWEILLRARAIENFCYVIASNQTGKHANGRATYGHSMIIDPWGNIISSLEKDEGFILAEINLEYLTEVREKFGLK